MALLDLNQQNICSSTLVESDILKRWKMASIEDNINISSAAAVKQLEPELGTAQPQLVYSIIILLFM